MPDNTCCGCKLGVVISVFVLQAGDASTGARVAEGNKKVY